MRRYIILAIILGASNFGFAQITNVYNPDLSNIPNPERGFYHHTETHTNNYSFLDATELSQYRDESITLILRLFYLEAFVDGAISSTYLENMQKDFLEARKAGVKMVLRFAYTKNSTAPYGDAPLDVVLLHISQLKPILKSNADVIAVVQAGFIGAWGEWYYTDHFSNNVGSPNEEDWNNRRALVDALLDAVPEKRMVQVRTPRIKMSLIEDQVALTETEAFTGTSKARLGHHNDCFVASVNDYGTYVNIPEEKAYLEQETNYLVMGGETCNVADPYSFCPNAVAELQRFHWSYLNIDYNQSVLGSWITDGCFEDVQLNLGYRYRLEEATITNEARPGDELAFEIKMINDGWSNIYNGRDLEFVLTNQVTGKEYFFSTDEDLRLWDLNTTKNINLTLGVPTDIPSGDYIVSINLPDPEPSLRTDPNYSIRLANTNTWDSNSGYNNLGITINISPDNTGNTYNGNDIFQERVGSYDNSSNIIIDGDSTDWNSIETKAFVMENAIAKRMKVYDSSDSLFIIVTGENLIDSYQLFFDTDQSSTTGYHAWQWTDNGAEILIENDIIYTHSGDNNAWGWTSIGSTKSSMSTDVLEIGFPISFFEGAAFVNLAFVNDPNNTIDDNYLPAQNSAFVSHRFFLSNNGGLFTGSDKDKIMLYWGKTDNTLTRFIEKSTNDASFIPLAAISADNDFFTDFDVEPGSVYDYKYFIASSDNISTYTESIQTSINESRGRYFDIQVDGDDQDWYAIPPLATQLQNDIPHFIRTHWGSQDVNFILTNNSIDQYAIYIDTDNSNSTGGPINNNLLPTGYDFQISQGSVLHYSDGSWSETGAIVVEESNANHIEIGTQLSNFTNLGNNSIINIATLLIEGIDTVFLPAKGVNAIHVRTLPSVVPANFGVRKSGELPKSRTIVTWDRSYDCTGYLLERSLDGIDFAEIGEFDPATVLYQDNDLEDETTYFYRIRSFTEIGPSEYSIIVSATTGEEILSISESNSISASLYPNPVHHTLNIKLSDNPGIYKAKVLSMNGQVIKEITLDLRNYGSTIPTNDIKDGLYYLILRNEENYFKWKFLKSNTITY